MGRVNLCFTRCHGAWVCRLDPLPSDLFSNSYGLFSDGDTPDNRLPGCAEACGETTSSCPLTLRELQLLMLMSEGLQNHEIATRISISSHIVRTHLYNSFGIFDARNRLEANAWIEAHISMLYLLI